jgi:hypothetical protein
MPVWQSIRGKLLNQGDLLRGIALPAVDAGFPNLDADGTTNLRVGNADVIVVSQSCDLEQRKIQFVVLAQIFGLDDFEDVNPDYKAKGKWKSVALGRIEPLYMLHGLKGEGGPPRECLVVDFRSISSLPIDYVEDFATRSGDRWRLQSPYLEGMSQAFGRFFMRVALPSALPQEFLPR